MTNIAPALAQELRVKGSYLHHKEVRAAQGIKIAAQNLENAVAGTQLLVASKDDSLEDLKDEVMQDIVDIFSSVDRSGALQLPCPTALAQLSMQSLCRACGLGGAGWQLACCLQTLSCGTIVQQKISMFLVFCSGAVCSLHWQKAINLAYSCVMHVMFRKMGFLCIGVS